MKFFKSGKLQDKLIVAALIQAAEDFANGEILEVRDLLTEIVDSITEFENAQED